MGLKGRLTAEDIESHYVGRHCKEGSDLEATSFDDAVECGKQVAEYWKHRSFGITQWPSFAPLYKWIPEPIIAHARDHHALVAVYDLVNGTWSRSTEI